MSLVRVYSEKNTNFEQSKTLRINSFPVKCFWYPDRLSPLIHLRCMGACQQVQDSQMLLKTGSFQLLAVFTRMYVSQLTAPSSPCILRGKLDKDYHLTKITIINKVLTGNRPANRKMHVEIQQINGCQDNTCTLLKIRNHHFQ